MTPDTDPGQTPDPKPLRHLSGVTPGKGVRLSSEAGAPPLIDMARRRRDYALEQRHPARLGLPPVPQVPLQPVERTLSDEEIERGARIVGMTDRSPRHRQGPPIRKRDAARDAVVRLFGGAR